MDTWLLKPRRRDGKRPGWNTGGPREFSTHIGLDSPMGGDAGAAARYTGFSADLGRLGVLL